ncbi:hypothetical protein CYY_009526 [Polysphondylium violaceum]|uniref:Methyltransferase type 11 domain-containing protein n=1 Tax=Polysphondylium violaceum TaxID=133409 RepID=A0A8J4PLD2_9MYCE|nr:hypothetical protein CYY_009526 [Polysphondylium violaceum]
MSLEEKSLNSSKKEKKLLYKQEKKLEKQLEKQRIQEEKNNARQQEEKNKQEILNQRIGFNEPQSDHEAYRVELKHVHQIYDKIALHFDSTRYKAWPIVENFLNKQTVGSMGVDVGCGNGKYLGINNDIYTIGSDICNNFTLICNDKHHEALVADGLLLPYKSDLFEYAISIAVIHHFATFQRRVDAIKEMLRVLKPGGVILVTSWATTQEWKGKNYENQDVMVPWLFQNQFNMDNNNSSSSSSSSNDNNRDIDINNENKKNEKENNDTDTPKKTESIQKSGTKYEVFHRYYHLFEQGEFESIVGEISNAEIIENNLDHDNYYCFIKKTSSTIV